MNGIVLRGFRVLLPALVLLAFPCGTQAGFQWISGWFPARYGEAQPGLIEEKPDGVSIRNLYVAGALASSYPVHDIYQSSPNAYISLSRKFSLTDTDPDRFWRLELDLKTSVQSEFTAPGGANWYYTVGFIEPYTGVWRYYGFGGYKTSLLALNGIYTFFIDVRLNMWVDTTSTPYSGYYKTNIDLDFRTSHVPEPASWLLIGQGVAAAGIVFVSKRRRSRNHDGPDRDTHGVSSNATRHLERKGVRS